MIVWNTTKANLIGTRITIADSSLSRLIGLTGRRKLDAGCGLLITPSSGIHTFGMRFAIDVLALNKKLQVVRMWENLPPFRATVISFKIKSVLELPAGQIQQHRIALHDQLEFQAESFSTNEGFSYIR